MKFILTFLLFSMPLFAAVGNYKSGAGSWKPPVSTSSALPATGNTGDCRAAKDTGVVYCWQGSSWAAPSGSGTVTSVGLKTDSTTDAMFANTTHVVTGSPITGSGNFTLTYKTQTANYGLFGPTTGAAAAPTFRAMISADLPAFLNTNSLGNSLAMVTDSSGNINTAAATTATELGYVHGVTSAIQTQLGTKAPTASPAFTTQVTFGNYHLEPCENNAGNSSTAITLDLSTCSAQKVTMTGNATFTLSNPVTGGVYVLKLVQDATGSRTYTWPGTVKWSGGTGPTGSGASKTDLINLYWDGTNYYGSSSLNY